MQRTTLPTMFYGAIPDTFIKAKELRKNMTNAEALLWERLKNNGLGVRFKAQHPISIYIADFYCHQKRLIIEVDGEIHKYKLEHDIERDKTMTDYGLQIIRFTNEEVLNNIDAVVTKIEQAILPPALKGADR